MARWTPLALLAYATPGGASHTPPGPCDPLQAGSRQREAREEISR